MATVIVSYSLTSPYWHRIPLAPFSDLSLTDLYGGSQGLVGHRKMMKKAVGKILEGSWSAEKQAPLPPAGQECHINVASMSHRHHYKN